MPCCNLQCFTSFVKHQQSACGFFDPCHSQLVSAGFFKDVTCSLMLSPPKSLVTCHANVVLHQAQYHKLCAQLTHTHTHQPPPNTHTHTPQSIHNCTFPHHTKSRRYPYHTVIGSLHDHSHNKLHLLAVCAHPASWRVLHSPAVRVSSLCEGVAHQQLPPALSKELHGHKTTA